MVDAYSNSDGDRDGVFDLGVVNACVWYVSLLCGEVVMGKEYSKGHGWHDAGKNRVWEAVGRLKGLVELEVSTTHSEIMADWSKTLAEQMRLVAEHAADKKVKKPTLEWVDPYYEARVEELLEYYAKVRVVELPKGGKKYVLVYGDRNNAKVMSGTGPFETQDKAWMWFLRGGR